MLESSVPDLLRRAQAGETEAFGELVDRFRDAVFALCYHRCGDFDTARDLAQDAFVRAFRHLGQLQDPERFPAWLRRVAERVCLDWRRRRRPEEPLEHAEQVPSPDSEDASALRIVVRQCLSALPEAQRLAVTLYHINGYSYGEIAAFLGAPETTVKARLDAGRERLRGSLSGLFEDALRAQRPQEEFTEEVMMRVTRVEMKESVNELIGTSGALLLLGDEQQALPIMVGVAEAMSIRLALNKAETPRPFTYDTFLNCLAAFGISVSAVRINRFEEQIYYAELELRQGDMVKVIDCRPSDAVNLALRADAPVEIDDGVFAEAGIGGWPGGLPDYQLPSLMPDLHAAALEGNEERVRALLASGADANERNQGGVAALQIAVVRQRESVVKALLEAGADVHSTDARGRTPLHHAAAVGNRSIVEALLTAGADRGAKDSEGHMPREVAANEEVAGLLGTEGS